MDGTRNSRDDRDDGARDQAYARPEWLDDFAEPPRGSRADDELWDREPAGWRSTVDRVRTTPRAAVALCAVGVIAAIVAAVAIFGSSGSGDAGQYPVVNFAGTSSTASASTSAAAVSSSPAVPRELVVAVVGLVRAPGLHRLAPGSRVADALTAARGTLGGADTAGLNLAQPLRDGDQVVVGVAEGKSAVKLRSSVVSAGAGPGAAGASGAAGGSSAVPGAQVNINTAGASELDRLPGVGAATAAAIISYREQNGPFKTVEDLGKVAGIGDAKLAKIKPMATV